MSEQYINADERYPAVAGWRKTDTSERAATFIQPHTSRLQGLFLEALRAAGAQGATSDEIAAAIGVDRCSVRPRATELQFKNLIYDGGERRAFNGSPTRSVVWQLVEEEVPA